MDSRTALLNAPRPVRRAVALAAPLILAALMAGAAVLVETVLAGRAEKIAEARRTLGTLQLLLAADPGPAVPPESTGREAEFLSGASTPLIQAALQARLGEIAAASGAELLSVGNTPLVEREGTRFAGLRANLTGTNGEVVETVFAIESSRPYLTIRTARIDAGTSSASDESGMEDPGRLLMQIEIEGALPPDGAVLP